MVADLVETFIAGIAPHLGKSGKGMKCLTYNITKVTQNDTVTLGDFATIAMALVWFPASGAYDTTTMAGNVLTLASATTGAAKLIVWGY